MGNDQNQKNNNQGKKPFNKNGGKQNSNPNAIPYRQDEKKKFNKNYFETNKMRAGDLFINQKNAEDLQRDAMNIFRDIARGRMDVRMYPQYFCDPGLLDALILKANEQLSYASVSFIAIQFYVNYSGVAADNLTITVYNQHKNSTEAYNLIVQSLIEFKTFANIELLYSRLTLLRNYRNYI